MLESLVGTGAGGFWEWERDRKGPFRWTKQRFSLAAPDERHRFVSLELASPMAGNWLSIHVNGGHARLRLLEGWQTIDIPVDNSKGLHLGVGLSFHAPGDDRALGLMLRPPTFHEDESRHAIRMLRHANALLNAEEFASGREWLESFPTHLRVTVSKRCNIANETPCVYCSWDWAKRMEQGSPAFTPQFLADMGPFMDLALAVTDCSYGEPPLESSFGAVVEMATSAGRTFEFTSNGQTLSRKKREILIGRQARLHVSIDAATAAGYNRYRDHRFELVVKNLRALCAERAAAGCGLPEVFVSYIVMRSNRGEVGDFLHLMKDVGVDRVTFRSLYLEDHLAERRQGHYGWQFDYDAECLDANELAAVSEECLAAGLANDIVVGIEWDEFNRNSGATREGEPLCSEPWKTAYFLDRGITPCCYGREAMIPWKDIDQTQLEASLHAAFNSEPMQQLRHDLSNGRLGKYCERAQGCPIVKRLANSPASGPSQAGTGANTRFAAAAIKNTGRER